MLRRARLLHGSILDNRLNCSGKRKYSRKLILIWDTGASYGSMPFRGYLIDYVKCAIPVKDDTNTNRVIGIGTTLHKLINSNGKEVLLPCV